MKTLQWMPVEDEKHLAESLEFEYTSWGGIKQVKVKPGFAVCQFVAVDAPVLPIDPPLIEALQSVLTFANRFESISGGMPVDHPHLAYLKGVLAAIKETAAA